MDRTSNSKNHITDVFYYKDPTYYLIEFIFYMVILTLILIIIEVTGYLHIILTKEMDIIKLEDIYYTQIIHIKK
jgi:hypothetical protein